MYLALGTTPERGTHPDSIVDHARTLGFEVEAVENISYGDLKKYHNQGYTLILFMQAWKPENHFLPWQLTWDCGHYVVLVEPRKNKLIVMDPALGRYSNHKHAPDALGRISKKEFLKRWHGYELTMKTFGFIVS